MSYNVLFIKQIHSNFSSVSSSDIWLERIVPLPFVPTKDITVNIDGWEATPIEITYDVRTGFFKVYVESDKTLYHKGLKEHTTLSSDPYKSELEKIIAEYVAMGWEKERQI